MTTLSTAVAENKVSICPATISHLQNLLTLENLCFSSNQLSRRSFRRFLTNQNSIFLIAQEQQKLVGYLLIIFQHGTRLARLYSLAVAPQYRGQGIARQLIEQGESAAQLKGALYYRLEVNTKNAAAIHLYHQLGFKEFKLLKDYYQDHSDAMRMQKRIRYYQKAAVHSEIPWFGQNTAFTCGPVALMMAMAALKPNYQVSLAEELELWREATTIFMTSGHGGCHPLGLALAAQKRGLAAQVWLNNTTPLFVDGVRSEGKKNIIKTVHQHFVQQSAATNLVIHYENITTERLKRACDQGEIAIVLISTYRMDHKKAPHWVVISGYDERCFYLHDPDLDDGKQSPMDCQYIPVAQEDFDKMSVFGANRMRTTIIIAAKPV